MRAGPSYYVLIPSISLVSNQRTPRVSKAIAMSWMLSASVNQVGPHALSGVASLGRCLSSASPFLIIVRAWSPTFTVRDKDPQTNSNLFWVLLSRWDRAPEGNPCCSASLLGHGCSCSSWSLLQSSTRARPTSIPVGQLRRSTWERRSARCKHKISHWPSSYSGLNLVAFVLVFILHWWVFNSGLYGALGILNLLIVINWCQLFWALWEMSLLTL